MSTTEQVEVTIQYVNPPKPGKKFGNIKTAEKGTIFCLPGLLKEFSGGQVRNIVIQTDPPREQGAEPFRKVHSVMPLNGAHRPATANTRPRMDPLDSIEARKTALLVAYATAGKISLERHAICKALDEIDAGCRMHGVAGAQRRDDMRDEIPEGAWAAKSENRGEGMDDPPFDP